MAHVSLTPTPMSAPFPGVPVVLALDLGTTTGWALQAADGLITSGTCPSGRAAMTAAACAT